MLSVLRTLYNNGENDGEILIKTKDSQIKCHLFVIENTSDYLKSCVKSENFNNIIELDSSFELVNIAMNYLYAERIIDKELSADEIINLYNLINQLKCKDNININILKNHYLKKFPYLIEENNWIDLLKYVHNINKYADFQEEILCYYKSNILTYIEDLDLNTIVNMYSNVNTEIKILLFSICLERLSIINIEIKNNTVESSLKTKEKMNSLLETINSENNNDSCEDFEDTPPLIKPMKTLKKGRK